MSKMRFNKMFAMFLSLVLLLSTVAATDIDAEAAANKVIGPAKITLSAKSKTLYVGEKYTLKVKSVSPGKASKSVSFVSSNKSVATVDSKGVIVAKKKGTATITATSKVNKKVKAACKVTVKQQVKSVTVSNVKNNKATLLKGKTLTLKVKVAPSTANNKTVKYSTSNKAVATVSSKGKITAKKAGTAKITVKSADGKAKKVITITVKNPVKLSSIKSITDKNGKVLPIRVVNGKNAYKKVLYTGNYFTVKVVTNPVAPTGLKVTWKSSNTKVATVSTNGSIKAIAPGITTVTATAVDSMGTKRTAKAYISVQNKKPSVIPVKKVEVAFKEIEFYANGQEFIEAKVTPNNTTQSKAVKFTSDNDEIVVDSKGNVKAVITKSFAKDFIEGKITVSSVANPSIKTDVAVKVILAENALVTSSQGVYLYHFDKEAVSYDVVYDNKAVSIFSEDFMKDMQSLGGAKLTNESLKNGWKDITVQSIISKSLIANALMLDKSMEITDVTDNTMVIKFKGNGKTTNVERIDNYEGDRFVSSTLVFTDETGRVIKFENINVSDGKDGSYAITWTLKAKEEVMPLKMTVDDEGIKVTRVFNDGSEANVLELSELDTCFNLFINKTYYIEFLELTGRDDIIGKSVVTNNYIPEM